MDKVYQVNVAKENFTLTVTSMFQKEAEITKLWRLDLPEINDPIEKQSKSKIDV